MRKGKWVKKFFGRAGALLMAAILVSASALAGCGGSGSGGGSGSQETVSSGRSTVLGSGSKKIRILSGSENRELEPVLSQYADKNHLQIEMTYEGSLDIMRDLGEKDFAYDAVWPASSIWMNAGDSLHRVKHAQSIAINPVVFGIRKSLAQELGFVGKEVSVNDILDAIMAGKLRFCMTSATQSNSGASAYLGFIQALAGDTDVIQKEDVEKQEVQDKLRELLSGIDRSSGSSEWLRDMFVKGGCDAMVNYECLIISANKELEQAGQEPLYVIYPYDGLSIADSPLGYVDQGDKESEERFLGLQEYLLSPDVQSQIQKTGRRTAYTGINEENKSVFKSEWGLQPDRVLSPFKFPDWSVIEECLNIYQSQLRKPSLTVYCLDYSGSMQGEGNEQLMKAMEQLLIQENAEKYFLQASADDVTILVPFDNSVRDVYRSDGDAQNMKALYDTLQSLFPDGGTDMYTAMEQGLQEMKNYDLSKYNPALIVMTDGQSQDYYDQFEEEYLQDKSGIPIFSIMYGDADSQQLDQLAQLSNARVFDGREDLVGAFQKVRGYN